ncbi:MAG: MMPL family transporter [Planctomycetes bacterium]|nr:MMPL family transporter [Planctomycetota bacterium]
MNLRYAAFRLVARFRWPLALAVAVLVFAFGPAMIGVQPNNSLRVWFLSDDPAVISYDRFSSIFGNDEVVVVMFHDPGGIYTVDNVSLIKELSDQLETLPEIRRVVSLSSGVHIRGEEDELKVEKLLARPPTGPEDVAALRARVHENPIFRNHIIAQDETSTFLLAYPQATDDIDVKRPALLAAIRRAADAVFGRFKKEYHLAGMGVVYNTLNEASMRDTEIFTGALFAVMVPVLWMTLRRPGRLLTALSVMAASIAIGVGGYVLAGNQLNMISSMLTPLILNYCVMDTLYIMEEYDQSLLRAAAEKPGGVELVTRGDLIVETMAHVIVPCFMTSFTTAAGFASMFTANMAILRNFGLWASIGILAAWALTMCLCPIGLSFTNPIPTPRTGRYQISVDGFLRFAQRLVFGRPGRVLAVCGAIAAVGIWGISRLKVDTYSIQLLKAHNPCRVDSDFVEQHFGWYQPLEIMLEAPEGDPAGMKDPARLRALDRLQARLEQEPDIGKTLALPQVVKRLNQVLAGAYEIPPSAEHVSQALILFESSRFNDVRDFANESYSIARLTVRIPMVSAQGMKRLLDKVMTAAHELLPPDVKITPAGYIPLYVKMMEYIAWNQISSFGSAFLVIFGSILVLFRSWRLTLVSIVPNVFPLFITMGVMGWVGIPLDVATVMIAPISIGMAVDDTIHLLFKYREEYRRSAGDTRAAVAETMKSKGAAVFNTATLLFLGYIVLCFADVKSVIYFGLLTAVTMVVGMVAEVFLTPALLLVWKPKV